MVMNITDSTRRCKTVSSKIYLNILINYNFDAKTVIRREMTSTMTLRREAYVKIE